tara:strand:- start:9781 stop:9900 length:120 start_codon:yes stop_codon:yes gene_type:complete
MHNYKIWPMSKIMVDEYGTLLYNEWSKEIIKSVLKADYL